MAFDGVWLTISLPDALNSHIRCRKYIESQFSENKKELGFYMPSNIVFNLINGTREEGRVWLKTKQKLITYKIKQKEIQQINNVNFIHS